MTTKSDPYFSEQSYVFTKLSQWQEKLKEWPFRTGVEKNHQELTGKIGNRGSSFAGNIHATLEISRRYRFI